MWTHRPPSGPGHPAVSPDEDGVTLIELIAAVTLLSVAFVAVLGALGVLVRSSRDHRQMANAQLVLATAAERVKAGTYVPCTTAGAAASYATLAAGAARPSDWGTSGTVEVVALDVWTGSTFAPVTSTCAAGSDLGLQRLTLRVTSPDGTTSDSLSVLKGLLLTAPLGPGNDSPCRLRNPGPTQSDAVTVTAGALSVIKLHLEPNSCGLAQPDAPQLTLVAPGLTSLVREVANPNSADPVWEISEVMPVPATPGWGVAGAYLTAVLLDSAGKEAGRFLLRIA